MKGMLNKVVESLIVRCPEVVVRANRISVVKLVVHPSMFLVA